MAIKIGKKAEEAVFKLYSGVAAFNVVAVNPDMATLSKLTGREISEEPTYKGKRDDDGVEFVRVTFWVKTDKTCKVNNGIDLLTSFSFTVYNERYVGKNSGKTQVLDNYGRDAWATSAELESRSIPQYSSGPANIDKDYRPAMKGEKELIDFIIQWLNIPSPATYNSKEGKWVEKADKSESEISLNMKKLMSGDVSEIREQVLLAKEFAVKACLGVRTDDKGRQFQQVFTKKFLKNSVGNYSYLDVEIKNSKDSGAYSTTEFDTDSLHEYRVESSKLENTGTVEEEKSPWDF